MLVIGLDLAGVETRPSGFCVFKEMKIETELIYSDGEIIQKIEKLKPRIIAIDAPLSLPKGRKSIEERTKIHLRECDKELLRRRIKFFPITLGPMRKLTERGIKLKKILKVKGFRVIEVYPGGSQDVWNIPRKQRGIKKLMNGLKKMGIKGLKKTMNDHELDAITCALTGKYFLDGNGEVLGTIDNGIVMPKLE
jgi:predicted nuclease with RNAse H fold